MRPIYFATTAAVGLTLAALAPAQRPAAPPQLSGKEIFQRTLKSVTWIVQVVEATGGRVRLMTGSGSLIDVPKRLVLTNYHVVGEAKEVAVFFPQFDNKRQLISDKEHYFQQLRGKAGYVTGTVVARSPKQDLAVIELPRLPTGAIPARLARESVSPGDTVHSIGSPGASGALWAYTPGSVKAVYKKKWTVTDLEEKSPPMHFEAQVVETTSPVNAGDSGGPLLNSAGELVAVTQGGALATQGTISFFIDLSEVRSFLKTKKINITTAPGFAAEATTLADSKSDTKADAKSTEAPAKTTEATDAEKQEKAAEQKLRWAKEFINDQPSKARDRLDEIVKTYPKTKAAAEAKELLKTLKK
jgi:S1-C subfamily serine protease